MSTVTVEDRFRCRRGTAAAWTSTNEVLLDSEIGLESDTGLAKIGDGTTAWNDLPYTIAGRVDLTGIADGSALVWDATSGRWIVGSVGGTWGRITGTLSAQTDLQTALAAKLDSTEKGAAGGVGTLDSFGKLDTGQLPALAITETFVVNTQAAMLALSAQEGDVAVRTDQSKSYILTTNDPATLANWQELLTPTSAVSSVFGRTGSVTATSGDYTFAQLAATPTTLAGYGITDAATAAQGAKADSAVQPWSSPFFNRVTGLGVTVEAQYPSVSINPSGAGEVGLYGGWGGVMIMRAWASATDHSSYSDLTITYNGDMVWNGSVVWHAGNLTPSNYALLAGATFTGGVQAPEITLPNAGTISFPGGATITTGLGGGTFFATSSESVANLFEIKSTDGALYSIWDSTCTLNAGNVIQPLSDGQLSLGIASLRWSQVYAATGTINTSDAREKTPVTTLSQAEIGAAKQLAGEIGTYRWLTSIAAKGDKARTHVGLTVQRAIEVMRSHGLDPLRYGFICYDRWDERAAVKNGDERVREAVSAGDRYSFRTDELAMFLARGFDARLAALEENMAQPEK